MARALHMSAFDPKRTWGLDQSLPGCAPFLIRRGRNLLLSGTARVETLMTMQNDQNRRPGFLENAMGHASSCGCGDNRGGVCLDGATSFVKCQARPRLALSGHPTAPAFGRYLSNSGQRSALAAIG